MPSWAALHISHVRDESQEEWRTITHQLVRDLNERLLLFALSDFDLAVQCYYSGLLGLEQALSWHGANFLFLSGGFKAAPWFYGPSSLSLLSLSDGREASEIYLLAEVTILPNSWMT